MKQMPAEHDRTKGAEEKPREVSFEQSLRELQQIVEELEKPDVSLERALELFEKGVKLSEACRRQLVEAESRIEILLKRGQKVIPQPFGPEQK
ncbi:MAG: exodeoxyribonuclease VII small subunit [Bryobacteraceae bacterium]